MLKNFLAGAGIFIAFFIIFYAVGYFFAGVA